MPGFGFSAGMRVALRALGLGSPAHTVLSAGAWDDTAPWDDVSIWKDA